MTRQDGVRSPKVDNWVTARERIEQLEAALESRTVIARAQGILMERYGVDADAAFAILKRTSNTMNVKVVDIAASLIETRRLPGVISDNR
ncbi:ANTAR domain-containing protein [Nocardioides pyridinolyticus]